MVIYQGQVLVLVRMEAVTEPVDYVGIGLRVPDSEMVLDQVGRGVSVQVFELEPIGEGIGMVG